MARLATLYRRSAGALRLVAEPPSVLYDRGSILGLRDAVERALGVRHAYRDRQGDEPAAVLALGRSRAAARISSAADHGVLLGFDAHSVAAAARGAAAADHPGAVLRRPRLPGPDPRGIHGRRPRLACTGGRTRQQSVRGPDGDVAMARRLRELPADLRLRAPP